MKLDTIRILIDQGYITCEKHPEADLYIYNYTAKTQYNRMWTPETMLCRGLILDGEGNIRARGFPKFFNYGEKMPPQDAVIVEATEKLDGSLGILYWLGDKPCIATRGSFVSDQAIWATHWIQDYADALRENLGDHHTLLFEIIYPENRVVVDYGTRTECVLIGAYNYKYYHSYLWEELRAIAVACGFSQPHVYRTKSVQEYLDLAFRLSVNEEGWVLRYSNGELYKIKGDAYRIAHKLMTGVSFNRVLEATIDGSLDKWLEGVPDEFLGTIRTYQNLISTAVNDTLDRVNTLFALAPKDDRKTFAQWVTKNNKQDAGYLFAMLDGKDVIRMIQKGLKDG